MDEKIAGGDQLWNRGQFRKIAPRSHRSGHPKPVRRADVSGDKSSLVAADSSMLWSSQTDRNGDVHDV
jgi:hypothetical protein